MAESRPTKLFAQGQHASGAVTIQRDAASLYLVWRDLEQIPRFIDSVISVQQIRPDRSRWTIRGPMGAKYSWTSDLIRDEPGVIIAWQSTEESDVMSAGSVRFRELPFERGTEVKVSLEYVPPGGSVGAAIAKGLGEDIRSQVHRGLHRFRQVMEAGEVSVTNGQPVGRNALREDRPGEMDRRHTDADVRDLALGKGNA